jgi:protease-4
MNRYLIDLVGVEDEDGDYQAIGYQRYLWLRNIELPDDEADAAVGLIVASGNIMDGAQPPGTIGGDSLAELIREARRDDMVESVVLRVDSGGGSAFASEVIRQELKLLQQEGKPLVISMGSMAASGGYWIAAPADEIWATPTTLTGSIGIFGVFPTIDKTLAKLGINSDGVGTTDLAGAVQIDRPLSPVAERAIQSTLEHGYSSFLDVVAEGREMSKDQVEEIAQGRVWSGRDAQRLGLVDKLGGLEQAIAAAAALADLQDYEVRLIEQPMSPQEQLLKELMGGEVVAMLLGNDRQRQVISRLQNWMAPFSSSLKFLQSMNDPQGLYVHCTACVAP